MRKIRAVTVAVAATLLFALAGTALVLRPRPLAIAPICLKDASDGTYVGVCQNKILLAVVSVQVRDCAIAAIDVLAHKESYMDKAREVAQEVVSSQSLQVDGVAGATLTRDTVLKAIENALVNAHGTPAMKGRD